MLERFFLYPAVKTLVLKTQNFEVVRSPKTALSRFKGGGGGAGKIFTEEDFKRRFSTAAAAKKENHAHFGRRYEGGSSRNFFQYIFFEGFAC